MQPPPGTALIAAINNNIPDCVPEHGRALFMLGYLESMLNMVLVRYPAVGEFVQTTYIEQ